MKTYDLIVIGAGSGLNVSAAAAAQGWKVAVIERGPMGGTCLNRGCIPSKMIIHAADVADMVRSAENFGVKAEINSIDFRRVTTRASEMVDADAVAIEKGNNANENIDLYKAEAHFVDDKVVEMGGEQITAKNILIAAGTRPFVPPIEGLDETPYITSDEALRLTKQPKSMAIIGGGYISCELGHFYGALGTDVTIIERGSLLVGREDGEVAQAFTDLFSKKHTVLLNHGVKGVRKEGDTVVVTVEKEGGETNEVVVEKLFVATGRMSNSDTLKLKENTSIGLNERGFIVTDERMKTNVEGVWALGDIVGQAPFKHGANMESDVVAMNMIGGHDHTANYSIMPHAIFSSPQVAGVGLTEEEAKEKGVKYEVRRYEYEKTGMGAALDEHSGFVKFLLEPKTEIILGCHILGPHASILIHEVLVAMTAGLSAAAVRDTIHIHPALSEVIQRAL